MIRILILLFLGGIYLSTSAQQDAPWQRPPQLSFSGFLDVFYVYDFNEPQGTQRQAFLFNHNRHNEFNLNLGLLSVEVDHQKYRAAFGLQTGTYVNDNLAAEPGFLKNIFEANIGISLSKTNRVWLDVGILPSHIGFESAVSMDNPTLTRSMAAENSPYFLTGSRVTVQPNDKVEIAALIVNGWQRIQRLEGNSLPSFGTQVTLSPTEHITFNWSTFIGTDDPDSTRRMRYFNNLYGQFQLTPSLDLIAGFDIGIQQQSKGSETYDSWLSPVVIAQYHLIEQWKAAVRMEYYRDDTGIIIPTGTINGFQTTGLSLNLDYSPTQQIMGRVEGRWLNSRDNIFETSRGMTNNNFFLGTSLAFLFIP